MVQQLTDCDKRQDRLCQISDYIYDAGNGTVPITETIKFLPRKTGGFTIQTIIINHKTRIIMKELIEKIAAEYAAFQTDANLQVEKGNKAAGVRARNAALELMKDLKEFRKASVLFSK